MVGGVLEIGPGAASAIVDQAVPFSLSRRLPAWAGMKRKGAGSSTALDYARPTFLLIWASESGTLVS